MGKRKRKEVSADSQNKSAKDDKNEIHLDPFVTSDEPVVKKVSVFRQICQNFKYIKSRENI